MMTLPNCVRCRTQLDHFTPFERGRCASCGLEYDELTSIANSLLEALKPFAALYHSRMDNLLNTVPVYEHDGAIITVGNIRKACAAVAKGRMERSE